MFGYSFAMADIQATVEYDNGKKEYFDVVKKLFPVGRFVVAGFSGSIETGYLLINDLKKWAVLSQSNTAWIPDCLVMKWHRRARYIFSKLPKRKTKYGISLLLVSVYPQSDNGVPGEAKTYGCIMESPTFKPKMIMVGKLGSIGSGNNIEEYISAIKNINKDIYNPLMQFEVKNPGGYGRALGISLSLDVKNNPSLGISSHFFMAEVRRGKILLGNNDHIAFDKNGSEKKIVMPKVANSWDEFVKIMKGKGVDLSQAVAIG